MERIKTCNNCEHLNHSPAQWGQPYAEISCGKELFDGICDKEDLDALSDEIDCEDFEDNGYYTSDDLWKELSKSEQLQRLMNSGLEIISNVGIEQSWNFMTEREKRKVLSSQGIETTGMVDLNKIPLHELVQSLYEEIQFKSDANSYVIGKLINFYWANSPKLSPNPDIENYKK